jgi:hypothetical protein
MKQKDDAVKGLTSGVAYLFKSNKVKRENYFENKIIYFQGYWYSWSW